MNLQDSALCMGSWAAVIDFDSVDAFWGEIVALSEVMDVEVLSAILLVVLDADSLEPEMDDVPEASTLPAM